MGRASWLSGAGRTRPGEQVDPAAGVLLHRVEGDEVRAGELVATVHAGDPQRLPAALTELRGALGAGDRGGADGRDRGPAGGTRQKWEPAGAVVQRLRGW